ncbi:DUF6508 domain-containing protein [Virgibacillus necropolis]|uniref:Uncharacterized protein n=1 Tax=Virgibacillus necropolis TaxID=163877 RepID=A0A221MFC1_9BACI|nr:DUF6508 domain-containing protein [Virgibacillus necropolis]ASN06368.1 hypothetical protein CFK40_15740 [Virgibacillus necropolis]
MKDYQKLYAYLPYFEKLSRDNNGLTDGKNPFVSEQHLLYTEYAKEMVEFAECFYEVGFVDADYMETLDEYGITNADEMDCNIPTADERLTKAILTKMIRDERFTSDAWVSYVEKSG